VEAGVEVGGGVAVGPVVVGVGEAVAWPVGLGVGVLVEVGPAVVGVGVGVGVEVGQRQLFWLRQLGFRQVLDPALSQVKAASQPLLGQ
jgi:hypothetical protein